MKYVLLVYYIVVLAEVLFNLVCYDGMCYGLCEEGEDLIVVYENICVAGFGYEVQCCIMIGIYVLLAGYYDVYYLCVQKVCMCIFEDFDKVFQIVDVILMLFVLFVVFVLGFKLDDLIVMYFNDVFMVIVNLVGVLVMLVLVGMDKDGLLLGLQIIICVLDEEIMFKVGYVIEDVVGFNVKLEKWWQVEWWWERCLS